LLWQPASVYRARGGPPATWGGWRLICWLLEVSCSGWWAGGGPF